MDPATVNLLVQGGTALVSLLAGFLLRHMTVPKLPPAPPPAALPPAAPVAHPLLHAFEDVLKGILTQGLQNVLASGAGQLPVVVNQPASKP